MQPGWRAPTRCGRSFSRIEVTGKETAAIPERFCQTPAIRNDADNENCKNSGGRHAPGRRHRRMHHRCNSVAVRYARGDSCSDPGSCFSWRSTEIEIDCTRIRGKSQAAIGEDVAPGLQFRNTCRAGLWLAQRSFSSEVETLRYARGHSISSSQQVIVKRGTAVARRAASAPWSL